MDVTTPQGPGSGRRPARSPLSRRMLMVAVAISLGVALPCPAQSLRVDYTLGLSYLHTDNVTLVETGEDEESVLAPELTIDANKQSSAVQLRARGSFQYLDYRSDAYNDKALGDFAGQLNWFVVPNSVALVAADYLGRMPIDVLGGLTPGNQQNINVFTAGPTFYLRPGDTTTVQMDLRYSDTHASESEDFNGHRGSGALRLSHGISESQTLTANGEATKVEFDNAPEADYTRYDAYAGYLRESERSDLEVALGYSRIERDGEDPLDLREDRISSPLGRIRLAWQIAPRSRVDLHARYELADSATDLVARSDRFDEPMIEDLASPNVVVGAELFKSRRVEAGYQFAGERLGLYLRPYLERVSYEDPVDAHWDARGVYLDANYKLRPRMNLRLFALHERRDVMDARSDTDRSVRLTFSYDFSRKLSGWIGAQRRDRSSNVAGADYRENTVMAGIAYRR